MSVALPQQRLVILGASNVARGIGTIASLAPNICGSPVEILAAMGHGRSYGLFTWAPCRRLMGILECGLWERLQVPSNLPTFTLLTDIGNDLVYGCSPQQVIEWVDQALDRLQPISQQVLITSLPITGVRKLSAWKFRLFRKMLFPKSQLSLQMALRHGEELYERVAALAQARGVMLFEPHEQWYGFDPIHIRLSLQRSAWEEMLCCLLKIFHFEKNFFSLSWSEQWRAWNILPERSVVGKLERYVPQPALVLQHGTRVAYY